MSGATVVMHDPRVSKAIVWLCGILGTGFISSLVWVGSSINELNTTVSRLVTQNESVFQRLDRNEMKDERQDIDIRDIEREVSELNGKQLRGGPYATR
jgi:hypothetical protein